MRHTAREEKPPREEEKKKSPKQISFELPSEGGDVVERDGVDAAGGGGEERGASTVEAANVQVEAEPELNKKTRIAYDRVCWEVRSVN